MTIPPLSSSPFSSPEVPTRSPSSTVVPNTVLEYFRALYAGDYAATDDALSHLAWITLQAADHRYLSPPCRFEARSDAYDSLDPKHYTHARVMQDVLPKLLAPFAGRPLEEIQTLAVTGRAIRNLCLDAANDLRDVARHERRKAASEDVLHPSQSWRIVPLFYEDGDVSDDAETAKDEPDYLPIQDFCDPTRPNWTCEIDANVSQEVAWLTIRRVRTGESNINTALGESVLRTLDAAFAELVRNGSRANRHRVAAKLGISLKSVYQHFETAKAAIAAGDPLGTAIKRAFEKLGSHLRNKIVSQLN